MAIEADDGDVSTNEASSDGFFGVAQPVYRRIADGSIRRRCERAEECDAPRD